MTRGDYAPSPYGDEHTVWLGAVTGVGVGFKHPVLGMCGCRFSSMDPELRELIKGDK